ncbi:hypothetical protein EDEG_00813 [Edhazardia aedis USNM 41457]|uniref:Uncharacterized protein n=1 Tax=Edhazardia aedis (strain USNM 41457) TaxID=1003232 RepID=J9DRB9_EDHAE|nr:hypothetical protein EDEG_00813 [Edhazardia aedis USNM 41457]|eukprot:EJW05100.1 hypothetical protein EDEG_00813 [Edhazardia aedis USNM 41457]
MFVNQNQNEILSFITFHSTKKAIGEEKGKKDISLINHDESNLFEPKNSKKIKCIHPRKSLPSDHENNENKREIINSSSIQWFEKDEKTVSSKLKDKGVIIECSRYQAFCDLYKNEPFRSILVMQRKCCKNCKEIMQSFKQDSDPKVRYQAISILDTETQDILDINRDIRSMVHKKILNALKNSKNINREIILAFFKGLYTKSHNEFFNQIFKMELDFEFYFENRKEIGVKQYLTGLKNKQKNNLQNEAFHYKHKNIDICTSKFRNSNGYKKFALNYFFVKPLTISKFVDLIKNEPYLAYLYIENQLKPVYKHKKTFCYETGNSKKMILDEKNKDTGIENEKIYDEKNSLEPNEPNILNKLNQVIENDPQKENIDNMLKSESNELNIDNELKKSVQETEYIKYSDIFSDKNILKIEYSQLFYENIQKIENLKHYRAVLSIIKEYITKNLVFDPSNLNTDRDYLLYSHVKYTDPELLMELEKKELNFYELFYLSKFIKSNKIIYDKIISSLKNYTLSEKIEIIIHSENKKLLLHFLNEIINGELTSNIIKLLKRQVSGISLLIYFFMGANTPNKNLKIFKEFVYWSVIGTQKQKEISTKIEAIFSRYLQNISKNDKNLFGSFVTDLKNCKITKNYGFLSEMEFSDEWYEIANQNLLNICSFLQKKIGDFHYENVKHDFKAFERILN